MIIVPEKDLDVGDSFPVPRSTITRLPDKRGRVVLHIAPDDAMDPIGPVPSKTRKTLAKNAGQD